MIYKTSQGLYIQCDVDNESWESYTWDINTTERIANY